MDSSVKKVLYKKIEVWKRIDTTSSLRYLCLEHLDTGKFCVQGADFFYLPITNEQVSQRELLQLELFIDTDPDDRTEFYDSLVAAISAHDTQFNNS